MSDDVLMTATDLLMNINGTELGPVLTKSKLSSQRATGGLRFMVGAKYDLFKYVAWLAEQKHRERKPIKAGTDAAYEEQKRRAAEHSRKISAAGRDIGPVPKIKNRARRDECEFDLKLFLKTYMPLSFPLDWAEDHLKAIEKLEKAVLKGGQFALAMPRGNGKTTLVIGACIWALMYAHRRYLALIAATEPGAVDMLDSIKSEFDNNAIIGADFPEICFPIGRLEGKTQLARGQTCQGIQTKIGWGSKEIKLPIIDGSKCAGSIVRVSGITGHIRGFQKKLKSGEVLRPDLVAVDDPQTDESANSLMQNVDRLKIVNGAILGLAGPRKSIAAFMPCTVIAEGDMVDQILNHQMFPSWQGQRNAMVISFPTNTELWEDYEKILNDSYERFGDIRLGTEFYKANREEMDKGAKVSWEARYNPDELSALQHAMNLMIRSPETFWSEYQNAPKAARAGDIETMTSGKLAQKLNHLNRFEVPFRATKLTAGMDVQGNLLFYQVMAWDENGNGAVIDYGTYPKQSQTYFTKKNAKRSYITLIEGGGQRANMNKAFEIMVAEIMDKDYIDSNGVVMQVDRMLIDANWRRYTDVVYEYVRRAGYANRLRPCHGTFYGAARSPMSEATEKPAEKKGLNWVITYPKTAQSIRYVRFDTNFWKSWLEDRMQVAMGGHGCFTLFGDNPERHKMFCDQVTVEYIVTVKAQGRTVDEWKEPVNRDNDYKDTSVMCCVAASVAGISLGGDVDTKKPKNKKPPRRKMSDMIAERRRNQ